MAVSTISSVAVLRYARKSTLPQDEVEW